METICWVEEQGETARQYGLARQTAAHDEANSPGFAVAVGEEISGDLRGDEEILLQL